MKTTRNHTIKQQPWGMADGKDVFLFRFTNDEGCYVEVTNYGAALVSVFVPDRNGKLENVVLSYASLEGYIKDNCYIGSTVGRFANRIGSASFMLDGVRYELDKNDGENTNHGGFKGFNSRVFDFSFEDDKLRLTLFSQHLEGGFPGNMKFEVVYSWSDSNELLIEYKCVSDKKTIANFTNHAYFNLSGGREEIFDHELTIPASHILETDDAYIPTGSILPAREKQFCQNRLRGKMLAKGNETSGLNTYYILDVHYTGAASILSHPASGRKLEVLTTYPGVQLYTGDFLDSEMLNDRGKPHQPFDGLCLECQFYPDSPNHAHFPSTVLEAGHTFSHTIIYRFSAEN